MVNKALEKILSITLSLVVLMLLIFGLIKFSPALLGMLGKYVDEILDLGLKPTPFDDEREEATTATASVHALLYSINKVAWYDTYKDRKKSNFDTIADQFKKFEGSYAVPLFENGEYIAYPEPWDKLGATEELTRRAIDCLRIFKDRGGSNSACYLMDFANFPAGETITAKEFFDFGYNYQNDPDCDATCQKYAKDLFGVGLAVIKYRFVVRGNTINKGDNIIICGGNKGKDEIHITDSDQHAYDNCRLPEGEADYGMKVVNFNIPQVISMYGGSNLLVQFGERWVRTYGDPEYILYYEIFPDGEDTYWHPSSFVVNVGQILTIEGIFLGLDLIPIVGRAMGTVLENAGAKKIITEGLQNIAEKLVGKTGLSAAKTVFQGGQSMVSRIRTIFSSVTDAFSSLVRGAKEKVHSFVLTSEFAEERFKGIWKKVSLKNLRALPADKTPEWFEESLSSDLKFLFNEMKDDAADPMHKIMQKNGKFTPDFLNRARIKFKESIIRGGVSDDVANNIATEITNELSGHVFLENLASPALKRLVSTAGKANDFILVRNLRRLWDDVSLPTEEKEKLVRELFEKGKFVNDLPGDKVRVLTADSEKAVQYALDMQKLNPDFAQGILGSKYSADMTTEQIEKALDEQFEAVLKDVNPLAHAFGKWQSMLVGFAGKKRHLVTALIVYSNALEDSIGEKFIPVGTNAIGLRTPYLATIVYDDQLTSSFDYSKDPNLYEEFFNYYGGYEQQGEISNINEEYLKYKGLLPEVNRYFLSLVKDKNTVREQPNQRLHIASPCKADITVTKTICECWKGPQEDTHGKYPIPLISPLLEHDGIYETDTYSEYYDQVIKNFDGSNKMLYTVGSNGVLLKQCHPKNFGETLTFWKDTPYKPSCIEINPLLDTEQDPNYCYHGLASVEMVSADFLLNWALPIGGTFACAGTTVGAPICGAVAGVLGTSAYAFFNAGHQWPSHS